MLRYTGQLIDFNVTVSNGLWHRPLRSILSRDSVTVIGDKPEGAMSLRARHREIILGRSAQEKMMEGVNWLQMPFRGQFV